MLTELIVVTALPPPSWLRRPTRESPVLTCDATTLSEPVAEAAQRADSRPVRTAENQVTGRIGGVPPPSSPPAEETVRAALLG